MPELNSGEFYSAGPNNGDDSVPQASEQLTIKVADGNNEIFFKIKRHTKLKKLMDAFCERQGKSRRLVRFNIDGLRVNDEHTPDAVSPYTL
jgi:small ubiquitin-related modifier